MNTFTKLIKGFGLFVIGVAGLSTLVLMLILAGFFLLWALLNHFIAVGFVIGMLAGFYAGYTVTNEGN